MIDIADPRLSKIGSSSRLLFGEIDGRRIGVVLATNSNPSFDTHALNCAELDRLKAGKNSGKLDEAWVIAVDGASRICRGEMPLEEAIAKLNGIAPRNGRFGEFYSLPADFFIDAPF